MSDFTFLTEEQVFGENRLAIFEKYGTKCAITDFSILLGGFVSSNFYTSEGNNLKTRTGWWWTKSKANRYHVACIVNVACIVKGNGNINLGYVYHRIGGARPVLPYSSIQSIYSNGVRSKSGIKEVEYGEYPQTIVDENHSRELERAYINGSLRKTGKEYTTDSVELGDYNISFEDRTHTEYEYNGNKYIRFVGDFDCVVPVLSGDRKIKQGQTYWILVEPITWLVDEENNIALAKKILFSGVQFKNGCYDCNFENTDIKQFMDNYFAKDIIPSKIEKINNYKQLREINGLDLSEVSEEDIIKGCVESDVSVFLHGKSSDGKSARVKQLDPNLEIIYLRNATPESLIGKSIYIPPVYKRVENPETKIVEEVLVESGHMEDIPPTWYINLVNKCQKEPDKIHILFLDELTNALPSIQSMAYNIVLDKEVNGKWKLPSNVRIVAAGNELEDSLAANELVEPMFNRFAHTYIETYVKDFIRWATNTTTYESLDYEDLSMPYKIHPIILAFISYKGDKVLRTKYNGKTPNADPRKWEMASRVLYKTKNPNMLRSLVGKELTNEFVHFCKTRVITIEDVLNGNYNEEELKEMDLGKKILTVNGMLSVDENNFEVIYEFVNKLGEETTRLFETLWAKDNLDRLEKIQELHQEKVLRK